VYSTPMPCLWGPWLCGCKWAQGCECGESSRARAPSLCLVEHGVMEHGGGEGGREESGGDLQGRHHRRLNSSTVLKDEFEYF